MFSLSYTINTTFIVIHYRNSPNNVLTHLKYSKNWSTYFQTKAPPAMKIFTLLF